MKIVDKYKIYLISFIPFLVTAIFSEGFLHPDEHFMTFELLQTKISNFTRPEIFNWDFHEKIRSWFQPFLYYLIYKITPFKDPFLLAFIYRLFHAALSWFGLYSFIKIYKNEERDRLEILTWTSWTWFIPFLLVRTSSESLSTGLFLIGLASFLRPKAKWGPLLSGLLWGASFLARYQMGVVILVANLWALIRQKNIKSILIHSLSVIFVILLGLVIDRWGYGEWAFSPYNYFYTNVIESRASSFGVDPFWFYLFKPVIKGGVLIPLVLILGFVLWVKRQQDRLVLSVVLSFALVHSLIPHKEVRFLILSYVLITLTAFIEGIQKRIKNRIFFKAVITLNLLFLFKVSLTPAEGLVKLYKEVSKSESKVFYTPIGSNGDFFKFRMPFYEKSKRETRGFELQKVEQLPTNAFIVSTKYLEYLSLKESSCQKVWMNYPEWVLQFNFFKWVDRSAITALWKCSEV